MEINQEIKNLSDEVKRAIIEEYAEYHNNEYPYEHIYNSCIEEFFDRKLIDDIEEE